MKKTTIDLGGQYLTVLVARTPLEWRAGLLGQRLADVDGMLFWFPHDVDLSFHMKGMSTPVLVAYFAGNGAFIDLNYMKPGMSACPPPRHYRYALELVGRHATVGGAFDLLEPLAGGLGCLFR